MELLKNLFKDEDKVIGLCGFRKEDDLGVFIPKFEPNEQIFSTKYEKNFFLL